MLPPDKEELVREGNQLNGKS
ncbi:MAG: hypothetical protein ACD_39C01901G0007, partial [uncultured bacterium]